MKFNQNSSSADKGITPHGIQLSHPPKCVDASLTYKTEEKGSHLQDKLGSVIYVL